MLSVGSVRDRIHEILNGRNWLLSHAFVVWRGGCHDGFVAGAWLDGYNEIVVWAPIGLIFELDNCNRWLTIVVVDHTEVFNVGVLDHINVFWVCHDGIVTRGNNNLVVGRYGDITWLAVCHINTIDIINIIKRDLPNFRRFLIDDVSILVNVNSWLKWLLSHWVNGQGWIRVVAVDKDNLWVD